MFCCCLKGLTEAAGSPVTISFTPHLMPMTRGMQSTCYVKMADGVEVQQLRQRLQVCVLSILSHWAAASVADNAVFQ